MYEISQIKDKVMEFVSDTTFADKSKITNETLIFKDGFFDSMGFISLISFIENEFHITTQDTDLIEENFESINAVANYVMQSQSKSN